MRFSTCSKRRKGAWMNVLSHRNWKWEWENGNWRDRSCSFVRSCLWQRSVHHDLFSSALFLLLKAILLTLSHSNVNKTLVCYGTVHHDLFSSAFFLLLKAILLTLSHGNVNKTLVCYQKVMELLGSSQEKFALSCSVPSVPAALVSPWIVMT